MKAFGFLFSALLAVAFCSGIASAKPATPPTYGTVAKLWKLELNNGDFRHFRAGTPFCRIGFGKENSVWDQSKARNYRNRLELVFGEERDGVPCLVVYGGKPRKETDTAWHVETRPIPFDGPAGAFVLDMKACADYLVASTEGDGYCSLLTWYDGDGKEIGKDSLRYGISGTGFVYSRTVGMIPNGAKSFTISLGFDAPNVNPGHFIAFEEIVLSRLEENAEFMKDDSWFETSFQKLDDKRVDWQADCPGKCQVKVQISEADDVDGKPGEWSEFHGLDGTSKSFYDKGFNATKPWARLRVVMLSDGKAVPTLKTLSFNGKKIEKWEWFVYKFPPLIENISVSPTRNRREDVVLRISSTVPVLWKTFSAKIDGVDATARFVRKGDCLVCPADKDYTDGLHKIEASIEDINGGKGEGVKYLFIGDNPVNVPHVTLRDDGMTLVDGKPFFPIGAYAVWKREFNEFSFEKAFKDLSEAGFNFAHAYNGGPEYPQFLDTAHKYGMRVWSAAYSINGEDLWKNRRPHPAIIAWYIGDDTFANTTPNQLQDRNDALKAIDDYRITTQADHVGSKSTISGYRGFIRGSDNYLPEVYPIHNDTVEDRNSSVAEVILDMETARADIDKCGIPHPKSIWPIIQYFQGWGHYKRFPEENEIRAMSFASIIHGATGITWYTYGGYHDPKTNRTNYGITSTPERWRIITTITRQLHELEPVLVERTPADQPKATIISGRRVNAFGFPSVTCLLKRHDGETYILSVNSTLDTVEATIPVPDVKGGSVMFENRAATFTGGALKDTFKPYEVHIYRLK